MLNGLWNLLRRERRCPACAAVYMTCDREQDAAFFCPACASLLGRRERGYCPGCGEPAAWPDLPLAPCLRCLASPPPWEAFIFHGLFQGMLRQLLLHFKFHSRLTLARPLGLLLARHPLLSELSVDCIVPVPLHTSRLTRRGYNQALELARPLARRLGLPCKPKLLERVRATAPQTGANPEIRKQNTLGAFSASSQLQGARVLLLDDIVTTGATVAAAAAALLEAGASGVCVAAVGRTARQGQPGKFSALPWEKV
jgi:ComF family protein